VRGLSDLVIERWVRFAMHHPVCGFAQHKFSIDDRKMLRGFPFQSAISNQQLAITNRQSSIKA
jgi:hypothetical protein